MKASDTSISGKKFIIIQACTRDCLQSLATFLIIICVYIREESQKNNFTSRIYSNSIQLESQNIFMAKNWINQNAGITLDK
jgi:hypothetical protein